jgi:hypothetical protein
MTPPRTNEILIAIAEDANWTPESLVDPWEAMERREVTITRSEMRAVQDYMHEAGWVDPTSPLQQIGLTARGIDAARRAAREVATRD